MGILKDNSFWIVIAAILIRLTLLSMPGFKFDVDAWFAWAIRLNNFSFTQFYSDQIWTNYTPGFLYILYYLGKLKILLNLSDSIVYLLIKIPAILAEILLGIFVYKQIVKKSTTWAIIGLVVILFNPAFIFNSSVWGQIDGILSLTMILSIYFLNRKNLITASILIGLSFLIKPQAIAILPIFTLYLIKNYSFKNALRIVLPAISSIFVLSIPFFINKPLGLLQLFSKMISDYSYTSLYAYNFWGIIGFWISDSQKWNGLSYQVIGYILFAVYWLTLGYYYFKKKLSLYSLATLALLGFFFLPTRVHERYLYPSLAFLIFYSCIIKSRLLIIISIILSLIHFLNLYYVYVYYNEIYLKLPKVFYISSIYNFLDNNSKFLSILSFAIFIFISISIIKLNENFKKN